LVGGAVVTLLPIPEARADWLALRRSFIGASEVAALFNLQAAFQPGVYALWMDRAGRVPLPDVGSERTRWGLLLEDAIAAAAAEREGWDVQPGQYATHECGLGATLDRIIGGDNPGCLELKNVDWLQTRRGRAWEGEPPIHVGIQLQAQLLATGFSWGAIAWLVGGNDLRILRYQAKAALQAEIARRVRSFWQSIKEDRPPSPDGSDATYAAILATTPPPEDDEPAELAGDNEAEVAAADYLRGMAMAKEAEALKTRARNVLLTKVGAHRWAKTNAATVSVARVPATPDRPAKPDEIIKGRAASVRITVKPYEEAESA
jgi:hypothetical protein